MTRSPVQSNRRRACTLLGGMAVLSLSGCATRREPPARAATRVPSFAAPTDADGLPAGWHPHVMRRDLPPTRYTPVLRDGQVVMHALAERATSGLRCDVDVDPQTQPWLNWSWRVDAFPAGITIADDERDDSPARVIVAFDGDMARLSLRDRLFHDQVELFTGHPLPYATLMYAWDGEAAPGTVIRYPRSSRVRTLVVESGAAGAGRWLHYRRNLVDDYRLVFGEVPGRVLHVGIATDSDDLKNRAEAWFGDLSISG
jgi:Protein of unknown function (DUF3047)